MDNLIGINGIIRLTEACGLLSFNECSVFHQVAIVSAGTLLSLFSSSALVGVGVSLCLGCGGAERMQRKEKDQISGGPGVLKAQGNCGHHRNRTLAASAFCLMEVLLTGDLPAGSKPGSHEESSVNPMGSP